MNKLIKLEEAAMFGLCIAGLALLKVQWWFYVLLLIGPDISMIGYTIGNKAGAFCYNLFHHKGIAILFFAAGLYFQDQLLQIIGIVLFGHSSMDRMFGYGLKYDKGFGYTHLGLIGKTKLDEVKRG